MFTKHRKARGREVRAIFNERHGKVKKKFVPKMFQLIFNSKLALTGVSPKGRSQKSKWKFKMDFSRGGGGGVSSATLPHTYSEK